MIDNKISGLFIESLLYYLVKYLPDSGLDKWLVMCYIRGE